MSKTWRRVNKDELRAYGPKPPRKPRTPRSRDDRVLPTSVKNLRIDDLDEDDFEDLYGDWEDDE